MHPIKIKAPYCALENKVAAIRSSKSKEVNIRLRLNSPEEKDLNFMFQAEHLMKRFLGSLTHQSIPIDGKFYNFNLKQLIFFLKQGQFCG